MIGKWIVCKRQNGGSERIPQIAIPVRIAEITSQAGFEKFNEELINGKKEYAYFESYSRYFTKRGVKLNSLPVTVY